MIPRPPAFLNHHQGSSSPCLLLCLNLHLSFWIALDQGRLSSAQPAPSSLVIPAHGALITQPPLSRSLLRLFPRFSFTFHKTHMTCLVSFSLWAFLLHFLFISSYSSGSLARLPWATMRAAAELVATWPGTHGKSRGPQWLLSNLMGNGNSHALPRLSPDKQGFRAE